MTTNLRVSREVFNQIQVGKIYRFDGRKGRVVAKQEGVVPVITVTWIKHPAFIANAREYSR